MPLSDAWFWAAGAMFLLALADRFAHHRERDSLMGEIHSLSVRLNSRSEPEARETLAQETAKTIDPKILKVEALRIAAEERLRRESIGDPSRFAAPPE